MAYARVETHRTAHSERTAAPCPRGESPLQSMADGCATVGALRDLQELADRSAPIQRLADLQATAKRPIQLADGGGSSSGSAGEGRSTGDGAGARGGETSRTRRSTHTSGLPAPLRTNIETLSTLPMDDVRVHYNSSKPAQLRALAFTQGADIHIGPGQQRHLAHEAWHVVQQKQGRVTANVQLRGLGMNDDSGLEHEADVMGAKAERGDFGGPPVRLGEAKPVDGGVVQRKIGFELQTVGGTNNIMWKRKRIKSQRLLLRSLSKQFSMGSVHESDEEDKATKEEDEPYSYPPEKTVVDRAQRYTLTVDNHGKDIEYISDAFELTAAGLREFVQAARDCARFQHSIVTSAGDTILDRHNGTFKLFKNGESTAHPHVTIGASFEMLRSLEGNLAQNQEHWGGSSSSMKAKGRESERLAYVEALDRLNDVLPMLELEDSASEAFLTIAATFVWSAKKRRQQHPKLIQGSKPVPIKLRTSAVAMWNSITSMKDRETLQALVFGKFDNTKATRKLWGAADPRSYLMVHASPKVTLGKWFEEVTQGTDLLAKHQMAEIDDTKHDTLHKFGMTSAVDTGLAGPGQIIELRALKRKIPYAEWASYMAKITKLVMPLDAVPKIGNYPHLPRHYNPALGRQAMSMRAGPQPPYPT